MHFKFVNTIQSKRVFAAFSKLRSNLKGKVPPDIDKESIRYFVHDFRESAYIGDVMNIDLKSAYATVLFRDGYINQDCYDYLCKSKKQERLASVGMLASRKQIFMFEDGRIIDSDEYVSETSNFFFHAVKRTGEIMDELKLICGNRYLFTWVDGIYFLPDQETATRCEEYVKSVGFNSTTEPLRDFNVRVSRKKVDVGFLKFTKGKWKPKPFNLPIHNTEFKQLMCAAILNKKK